MLAQNPQLPTPTCISYRHAKLASEDPLKVNAAYAAFGEGFLGVLVNYKVCPNRPFNADDFIDFLKSYCADNPDKNIKDVALAFACPDGMPAKLSDD